MTNWEWLDADVPARKECVLSCLLYAQAEKTPKKLFARFEDGTSWSYADALAAAERAASGLQRLGVEQGDVVLLFMPNGPEFLRVWFGANFLGASIAAPNTALRGNVLEHAVNLSGAKLAVVHEGLLSTLETLEIRHVRTIVVAGDRAGEMFPGVDMYGFDALTSEVSIPLNLPTVQPWDIQLVMFTSGTTGPSKGAVVTYVQMYDMVMTSFGGRLGSDDRYLLNMPLFHVGGLRAAYGMLLLGGAICVVSHFRTDTFLDVVREQQATACVLLGAAASFLENMPVRPDDSDNPLRFVAMVPLVKNPKAWGERFGVDVSTSYGMSELSIPIISEINPANSDSCGRLRPGYEARIVDENDCEVPVGSIGELILRADRPWTISPYYLDMPEATAEAWRNGWFHTGDSFKRDAEGNFYFVDRKKDAIRRRGENISSYEVEREILTHPDVAEAAVVATPSPYGEDDVLAVIAMKKDAAPDPAALFEFLRPRMAHFMLPRYIRLVRELPKTPSLRVKKYLLRDEGVTPDTWDREEAGIRVKRERI